MRVVGRSEENVWQKDITAIIINDDTLELTVALQKGSQTIALARKKP